MNKEALLELANICKEKKREKGITSEALFEITKIQADIIEKLLNDEEYILKNFPYSKFLLLQIARALEIDIEDFKRKLKIKDDIKTKDNVDFKKVKKTINTAVVSVLTISTMIYASTLNNTKNNDDNIYKYLEQNKTANNQSESKILLNNSYSELDNIQENKIEFIAEGDIWLTAYIDGIEKVIKLKKGERKTVTFFSKIKIETLGNPQNLTINFKGKKVKLSPNKKILHNIFIDNEGIFINGYNQLYNS
jgi:hypothetical protein